MIYILTYGECETMMFGVFKGPDGIDVKKAKEEFLSVAEQREDNPLWSGRRPDFCQWMTERFDMKPIASTEICVTELCPFKVCTTERNGSAIWILQGRD